MFDYNSKKHSFIVKYGYYAPVETPHAAAKPRPQPHRLAASDIRCGTAARVAQWIYIAAGLCSASCIILLRFIRKFGNRNAGPPNFRSDTLGFMVVVRPNPNVTDRLGWPGFDTRATSAYCLIDIVIACNKIVQF